MSKHTDTTPETKRPYRPAGGGPPRGTMIPFAKGHAVTMTAGHRSPRVYGELAQHLAAGLTDDRPDLAAYPEAVAAWATAEAQTALARRYIAEEGWLDPDTNLPRDGVLTWLRAFERLAAQHRATLGLDPRSEAALARERASAAVLAVDLDGLAERGRTALQEREDAGIEPPRDVAGDVLARVQAEGAEVMAEAAKRNSQREIDRQQAKRQRGQR